MQSPPSNPTLRRFNFIYLTDCFTRHYNELVFLFFSKKEWEVPFCLLLLHNCYMGINALWELRIGFQICVQCSLLKYTELNTGNQLNFRLQTYLCWMHLLTHTNAFKFIYKYLLYNTLYTNQSYTLIDLIMKNKSL